MKSIIILLLGCFLISNKNFSQNINKEKVYISSDSLSFIHLLPNQKFGYISYKGQSPLSYKNQKKGLIDGSYLIINEFGSGKYSITENKIKLDFIESKYAIDSVSISKTDSKNDYIKVTITFKSYVNSKNDNGIGIGSIIQSSDNYININTMFDDFASFTINKEKLPLNLTINENYNLEIVSQQNQDIILFVNDFKKFSTKNIENKEFELNKLIKQVN